MIAADPSIGFGFLSEAFCLVSNVGRGRAAGNRIGRGHAGLGRVGRIRVCRIGRPGFLGDFEPSNFVGGVVGIRVGWLGRVIVDGFC